MDGKKFNFTYFQNDIIEERSEQEGSLKDYSTFMEENKGKRKHCFPIFILFRAEKPNW